MDIITTAMALAQLAPTAVRWLTGSEKAEAAAEKVVDIARQVTGEADPQVSLQTLQADPAALMEFRRAISAQEAELDREFLADRQNARGRDIELHQAGYRNTRADIMVALDVVGLIACLVVIALYREALPGEVVGIISTVAGIFGACLRDAHQFEFGSSRGSREKDALLSQGAK